MKNFRPSMFRRPPTWGLPRRSLKLLGKLSDPTYNAPCAKINFISRLQKKLILAQGALYVGSLSFPRSFRLRRGRPQVGGRRNIEGRKFFMGTGLLAAGAWLS